MSGTKRALPCWVASSLTAKSDLTSCSWGVQVMFLALQSAESVPLLDIRKQDAEAHGIPGSKPEGGQRFRCRCHVLHTAKAYCILHARHSVGKAGT